MENLKVLVIDDQRAMRSIIRGLLKSFGIKDVVESGDGKEAIATLSREKALAGELDLIICDLHMENMGGMEFVSAIRKGKTFADALIPIIILTGDREEIMHEVILQVGATMILNKPISAQDLAHEIQKAIGFLDG
jgi:CheY-like chemotaxis protein